MMDLEDELIRFPKGRHDDLMDALASQLEIIYAPVENSTEEEYFAELESDIDENVYEPTSRVTGY